MNSPRVLELDIPAAPSSVRLARLEVTRLARSAGLPSESVDRAALATSEIVTNALVHGRAPLVLSARVDAAAVRVALTDAATERLPVVSPPDDGAPGGRGLPIVASVASEWGCDLDGAAKTVWFEIRA
jgi:anti-sigma regulatory factor (Ser/Thr protein kinase)